MTDFIINDHILSKECDALAAEIFSEVMADPLADVALGNLDDCDPADWRDDMSDRAHETADGHEWAIYYHKAIMLCAHCNTDEGDAFLEDTGMPKEITFEKLATIIAYGEIKSRIETALNTLCDEWEPADEPEAAAPAGWSTITA